MSLKERAEKRRGKTDYNTKQPNKLPVPLFPLCIIYYIIISLPLKSVEFHTPEIDRQDKSRKRLVRNEPGFVQNLGRVGSGRDGHSHLKIDIPTAHFRH